MLPTGGWYIYESSRNPFCPAQRSVAHAMIAEQSKHSIVQALLTTKLKQHLRTANHAAADSKCLFVSRKRGKIRMMASSVSRVIDWLSLL